MSTRPPASRTPLVAPLLSLAVAAQVACRGPSRDAALQQTVSALASGVPGAVVGVYARDLERGDSLDFQADTLFHAASTMKVPVMLEYFRALDAGRLPAGQQVTLENRFASIVDGSTYALDPGEDSDSALYLRVGQDVPVRELVERMITRSSNLATNAVIALVDAGRAQATARGLGASTMTVLRGVEDDKAFREGLNNATSARDLGVLLEAIANGRAASPRATTEMMRILEAQEFNGEIPAGLPSGTRVAHKTGQITGVLHDAAVVFPAGRAPYVLVVLTRGIPDEEVARGLIREISRAVWTWATGAA